MVVVSCPVLWWILSCPPEPVTDFTFSVDIFDERIRSNDFTAELILNRSVVEHFQSEYHTQFQSTSKSNIEIWETTSELPFGLIIVEAPNPCVLVFIYDSRSRLNGVLQNNSSIATRWALNLFQEFRSGASRTDRNA
jgi:predicted transcriptional regulator